MCKVFGVSTSAFYDWERRPLGPDFPLVREAIRAVQIESDRTYGYRRMLPELRSNGHACGKKLIRRLMREERLQGRLKRTRPYGKSKTAEVLAVPNVLDRQFVVEAPNQVWASDITYIRTRAGWVYLAVILDLYARVVVGLQKSAGSGRSSSVRSGHPPSARSGHPASVFFTESVRLDFDAPSECLKGRDLASR
jgi:hypothetical protein